MTLPQESSARKFRPEIQALRALAVILVVVNHVWPSYAPGGYVGVDVFFVISGFLITSHLALEISQRGTVSLAAFWARRIRRLLPAACTVLIASLALAMFVLTPQFWNQNLREILGAAFYVENWVLAGAAVDYLAADGDPSLVQHYWSLSVEEQFYILWPLLFLAVVSIRARIRRRHGGDAQAAAARSRALLGLVATVALVGFAVSILWTEVNSATAYFSTFTRMWEFAIGGLLAFLPMLPRKAVRTHLVASWTGLGLILASALAFDAQTSFPGFLAAMPVIGTALVIWAGDSASTRSPVWLARFAPVQFTGDISYGIYLWHWPLVVVYPLLRGNSPGLTGGALIVAATFVLAYLTKRFIEDPIRSGVFWRAPRRSLGLGGVLMGGVAAVTGATTLVVASWSGQAASALEPFHSAQQVQAAISSTVTMDRFPFPDQFPGEDAQVPEWVEDGCISVTTDRVRELCVYGDTTSSQRMVLIGDSYATHLLPALRGYFGDDWRIEVRTLGQCPLIDVPVRMWGGTAEYTECDTHNAEGLAALRADPPDLLIASDATASTIDRVLGVGEDEAARMRAYEAAIAPTYQALAELGVPTVVVESAPRANCKPLTGLSAPKTCEVDQDTRLVLSTQDKKEAAATQAGLGWVSMSRWLCTDDGVCPSQAGHALIHADGGHLTGRFSAALAPVLGEAISTAVGMIGE